MASNYTPGVDCVVVNFHTMNDLENFIMSYGYDSIDTTLHVVNVEETPAEFRKTDKLLKKVDGVVRHTGWLENVGYAKSCNYGAANGNHDVIALFNADTQLYEDTLSLCHNALMSHDDWGVLGPMQVNTKGQVTHGGILGTPTAPYQRGWKKRDIQNYRDVQEAVSIMGSAYFIKRDVWDELTNCKIYRHQYPNAGGAFLETPHYFEETYCSYHARAHGYKVIYYGEAMMMHEWHTSSPVGVAEKLYFKKSEAMFKDACEFHGIEHNIK